MQQRDAIITEARTWIGTPYHHGACLKGVGVDCGRLLEGIAKALGLLDPAWKPAPYSPEHHFHRTEEFYRGLLEDLGCLPVAWEQIAPGVIITFRLGRVMSHSGIMMPGEQLVHAVHGHGVILNPLRGPWSRGHDQSYDFPPRQEPLA